MELHQKDLNLALNNARQVGLSLPSTAVAQELFNSCAARDRREAPRLTEGPPTP
jgi:3-hydroxyisobutyrate dehydrogenase-like beta-hydroxyacid dehydrogenase